MPTTSLESLIRAARRPGLAGPVPDLDEVHGRYRVRFARDGRDLASVFRLRFEVFNLELGEGLEESFATGLDRDPFDPQCQHLLVIDEETNDAIGTYRLQVRETAELGHGFYSATEYDLSPLGEAFLDDAVELGRACIARAHRKRAVLYLLWRGLIAYVLWHGKRWFFGCSSLTSQDPAHGLRAYAWLREQRYVHPELLAEALPACACEVDGPAPSSAGFAPPTLLATYLRYGARVCSPPAIDRFFGTIDFLTLLDVAAMERATFELLSRALPRRPV